MGVFLLQLLGISLKMFDLLICFLSVYFLSYKYFEDFFKDFLESF